MLAERSLAVQHQLAEQAAADDRRTGIEKIVGDFWATGMDEAKIDAQGIAPLNGRLAEIDALPIRQASPTTCAGAPPSGENVLFGFGPEADFKNSSMNIAYATQGGLGLPDKGYYFDADKKDKLDGLPGAHGEGAGAVGRRIRRRRGSAGRREVIAFETRLAKASKSSEELSRDVSLYYNPVSPAEADKLTPNFPWTAFFESQGVAAAGEVLAGDAGLPPGSQQDDRRRAGRHWQAYLRFHTVDGASPYLSEPFVQEHYDVLQQDDARPEGASRRAGSACSARSKSNAGEAMGQLYVKVAFPAESKAQDGSAGGEPRHGAQGAHREPDLDERRDQEEGAGEVGDVQPRKIGYPDKWRDWTGLQTSRDSYFGNALAAECLQLQVGPGQDRQAGGQDRVGHDPADGQRLLQPAAERDRVPGRHPAAAVLRSRRPMPAMNYGAIGAVIGHEMTHGYDDQGSRFGPTGNFENWWTDADAKGFASRTDKLVKQFNGYEALPGLQGQRQADPGREHRRPGRPGHRLRRDADRRRRASPIRRPTA